MSIFKETDDYLTKALRNVINCDTDDDSDTDVEDSQPPILSQEPKSDDVIKSEELILNPDNIPETRAVPSKSKSKSKPNYVDIDSGDSPSYRRRKTSDSKGRKGNPGKLSSKQQAQQLQKTSSIIDHTELIVISSDEDESSNIQKDDPSNHDISSGSFLLNESMLSNPANMSLDMDRDYNLKIMYLGNCLRIPTKFNECLKDSLQNMLMELESRGRTLTVKTRDDLRVSLDESPSSLHLTPASILEAFDIPIHPTSVPSNRTGLTLKLQDGNRKHTREYIVQKLTSMLELKKMYAADFGLDSTDNIKLMFDGDLVDDEATVEELDMEDGCVIDVLV